MHYRKYVKYNKEYQRKRYLLSKEDPEKYQAILSKSREYAARWRKEHPEEQKKRDRRAYLKMKADPERYGKVLERRRLQAAEWAKAHPKVMREKALSYGKRARKACLEHYGGTPPSCACCGESLYPFLTLDHIDGNGAAHRKEIGANNGWSTYRWVIRNKFPPGFQILCWNCNIGKKQNKDCPHKTIATIPTEQKEVVVIPE